MKRCFFSMLLMLPILIHCTASTPVIDPFYDLPRLLQENEQVFGLTEFKDTREMLELKLLNLALINNHRMKNKLETLALDILASRVANKHCQEMAEMNYISHWNLKGEKPYHRYAFAGGTDAVMENIHILCGSYSIGWTDRRSKLEYLNQGHSSFMAEKPPFDGHRKNILNPYHSAVGIGCYFFEKRSAAILEKRFSYAQEFLNKYVEIDDFPTNVQPGQTIHISGKIFYHKLFPFLLLVYYEPRPEPMSLFGLKTTYSYDDFTDSKYATLWNQFNFDKKDEKFNIDLSFEGAKAGLYYVKIYLSNKKGPVYNSEDGFPVTSIVIEVCEPIL